MKTLFRRAVAWLPLRKRPDPTRETAVPLVHLLDDADPAGDMLAGIEARLDAQGHRNPALPRPWRAAWFGVGLVIGGAVIWGMQDRQSIVVQPAAGATWIPMGSVGLYGPNLRSFVRAKCNGHTHFFITMHGTSRAEGGDAVPLLEGSEKILMECIF